ncbi:hypothetical protein [Chroococcus sp. FPU101]|uniref:hypothetical protein n=1 Tax=Chroococcus sp. FPU101 TaxID=1974212 RepID=UPI001AAC2550|nr:hypothetical protein [Chroococcus sp. FPU101]GFE72090.1 hypothetical protein CFPU101_47000 [Chroococcus sp. FPU101]
MEVEENERDKKPPEKLQGWQRQPHQVTLNIPLTTKLIAIPDSQGLKIEINKRPVRSPHLPDGTSSVSIFLVNALPNATPSDCAFIFQTCLMVHCREGFVPRSNPKGFSSNDLDEAIAALQYRHDYEFAVGHNVSVSPLLVGEEQEVRCQTVHTTWIPVTEVPRVAPAALSDVELGMEALANLRDVKQMKQKLTPLVTAYRTWIDNQRKQAIKPPEAIPIAQTLLDKADVACRRITEGINALDDPSVLTAFCLANKVISIARRRQLCQETDQAIKSFPPPQWRPFQLAFILLNLPSLVSPEHIDRKSVDLLFFPTGGGKTEAYLGIAAFTLILRRLTYEGITSAGATVLMRYTLRLLTLDQLERASRLICALELERQQNPQILGT